MPPASTYRASSWACSALTASSGVSRSRLQKASSRMRSLLGAASSRKSCSMVISRRCTSSRRYAAARAFTAEEILEHAALTAASMATLFFSVASTLTMTLATACLASCSGPLGARATVAWWLVRQALTAATSEASAAASFSPSWETESGVAKVSSWEPSREASGCVASSSLLAVASIASTRSFTALRIAVAVLRSRTSCCACFSASSRLE
mmetsp:Transcript_75149/g.207288  ORF Transcript_75149/g.207288 Transcript_75149/m.207288 type:complete len:210 (+) Transcript_75149:199-828(+)